MHRSGPGYISLSRKGIPSGFPVATYSEEKVPILRLHVCIPFTQAQDEDLHRVLACEILWSPLSNQVSVYLLFSKCSCILNFYEVIGRSIEKHA